MQGLSYNLMKFEHEQQASRSSSKTYGTDVGIG